MISKKHKFIYIHIPKTGGNSIQNALADYCDDRLIRRKSIGNVVNEDGTQGLDLINEELGFLTPEYKHASINDYYEKLGEDIGSYFIFSSVRNPWDRVISQTAFLSKKKLSSTPLKYEEFHFPDPMLRYISINGKSVPAAYVRFENLQNDFDSICDRIRIPRISLPHKNRSFREQYQLYYTAESAALIGEKYRDDIQHFNYEYS